MGKESRQALILAGGLGTRLKETIGDVPKPMAMIRGRPFLEYLIMQLRRFSFNDITLLVGYGKEAIKTYFGDGNRWGVRIGYTEEKELLGTGGALRLALELIQSTDVLIMNGDSYADTDLEVFFQFHKKNKALLTMLLVPAPEDSRYGFVEVDRDHRLISFKEKNKDKAGKLINAGLYAANREFFEEIPKKGPASLENNVIPSCLDKRCFGFVANSYFIDIGTPESYTGLLANPDKLQSLLNDSDEINRGTDYESGQS